MATLAEQLELHEGRRRFPYTDTVGKLTIGVGRNLTDRGLRPDEIALMLRNDIAEAERECRANFSFFHDLDSVRKKVVIDMAFNLGITKLLEFKDTLKAIAERRWDDAARFMLRSKWAKDVGARAVRLAQMMRTGKDYDA